MPRGKGTYGSRLGRPHKKKKDEDKKRKKRQGSTKIMVTKPRQKKTYKY